MDSLEYKIEEFEINVKSVMNMEDRSIFINKTFYDNDNEHQMTLYKDHTEYLNQILVKNIILFIMKFTNHTIRELIILNS